MFTVSHIEKIRYKPSLVAEEFLGDLKLELNLDDKAKIIGCWNGLAKRILNDEEGDDTEDKTQ